MILAGEIGATKTRLAAFENEGNRLNTVVEKTYLSQQESSLPNIISNFVKTEGIPVHSACFGVAGPVRGKTCKISNLAWTIDADELAGLLKLKSVGLINDLEAYAYGIDGLESKDFVTLSEGHEDAIGNRAVISARTGLGGGRSVLGWVPSPSVCLRRGAQQLLAGQRTGNRTSAVPAQEARPRELRARAFGTGHQEHLRVSA